MKNLSIKGLVRCRRDGLSRLRALAGLMLIVALCAAASARCEAKPILQILQDAGEFSTLLKAIRAAGLEGKLNGPGGYTLFAPTDQAFAALPATAKMLLEPGHEAELQKVLVYHLLAGRLTTAIVRPVLEGGGKAAATTLVGLPVVIGGTAGAVQVNEARVTKQDVAADNGIIQVIDAVLLPPKPVQPQ